MFISKRKKILAFVLAFLVSIPLIPFDLSLAEETQAIAIPQIEYTLKGETKTCDAVWLKSMEDEENDTGEYYNQKHYMAAIPEGAEIKGIKGLKPVEGSKIKLELKSPLFYEAELSGKNDVNLEELSEDEALDSINDKHNYAVKGNYEGLNLHDIIKSLTEESQTLIKEAKGKSVASLSLCVDVKIGEEEPEEDYLNIILVSEDEALFDPLNTTELAATIKRIEEDKAAGKYYTEEDYYNGKKISDSFWAYTAELIERAKRAMVSIYTSQTVIDDFKTGLEAAEKDLIKTENMNLSELYRITVNQNDTYKFKDIYTPFTFGKWEEKLNVLKELLKKSFDSEGNPTEFNKPANKPVVDSAILEFQKAKDNLIQKKKEIEYKILKTCMEGTLALIENLNREEYREESLISLDKAVTKAMEALKKYGDYQKINGEERSKFISAYEELYEAYAVKLKPYEKDIKVSLKVMDNKGLSISKINDGNSGNGQIGKDHFNTLYYKDVELKKGKTSVYDLMEAVSFDDSLYKTKTEALRLALFVNGKFIKKLGPKDFFHSTGFIDGIDEDGNYDKDYFKKIHLKEGDEVILARIDYGYVSRYGFLNAAPLILSMEFMGTSDFYNKEGKNLSKEGAIKVKEGEEFELFVKKTNAATMHKTFSPMPMKDATVFMSKKSTEGSFEALDYSKALKPDEKTEFKSDEDGRLKMKLYEVGWKHIYAINVEEDEGTVDVYENYRNLNFKSLVTGATLWVYIEPAGKEATEKARKAALNKIGSFYEASREELEVFTEENPDILFPIDDDFEEEKNFNDVKTAYEKAVKDLKEAESLKEIRDIEKNFMDFAEPIVKKISDFINIRIAYVKDTVKNLPCVEEIKKGALKNDLKYRKIYLFFSDNINKYFTEGKLKPYIKRALTEEEYEILVAAKEFCDKEPPLENYDPEAKYVKLVIDKGKEYKDSVYASFTSRFFLAKVESYKNLYTLVPNTANGYDDPDQYEEYCKELKTMPMKLSEEGSFVMKIPYDPNLPDFKCWIGASKTNYGADHSFNYSKDYYIYNVSCKGFKPKSPKINMDYITKEFLAGENTFSAGEEGIENPPTDEKPGSWAYKNVLVETFWKGDALIDVSSSCYIEDGEIHFSIGKHGALNSFEAVRQIEEAFNELNKSSYDTEGWEEILRIKESSISEIEKTENEEALKEIIKRAKEDFKKVKTLEEQYNENPSLPEVGSRGSVYVSVENTTYKEGAFTGEIIPRTKVALNEDSTMMSVVLKLLEKNGYSWKGTGGTGDGTGTDITYLAYIKKEGKKLGEFDGGGESGWMGTLNDWFTNFGFAEFKANSPKRDTRISDGDIVRIMYTSKGLGADIGGSWGNSDTSLKSMSVTGGRLTEEFEKGKTFYAMIPDGDKMSVNWEASNKNYQVRVYKNKKNGDDYYRPGEVFNIKKGDKVYIGVGEREWPSMNKQGSEARPYVGTWYTVNIIDTEDYKAVERMIKLIEMPVYNRFLEKLYNKEEILSAKAAFEALSKEAKEKVTNREKLDKAVARLKVLQAVVDINEMFRKLPRFKDATEQDVLSAKESIKAINEIYKGFTKEQKSLVNTGEIVNYNNLLRWLKKISPDVSAEPISQPDPLPEPGEKEYLKFKEISKGSNAREELEIGLKKEKSKPKAPGKESMVLTKKHQKEVLEKGFKKLTLRLKNVRLTADASLFKKLWSEGGEFTYEVSKKGRKELKKLKAIKKKLGKRPVFSVKMYIGSREIKNLGGKYMNIKLPCSMKKYRKKMRVYAVDIENRGKLIKAVYMKKEKTVAFKTKHTGTFGISIKKPDVNTK